MSKVTQQIAALTEIRKLVEKHFLDHDFYYIESGLRDSIDLEAYQEIVYNEDRKAYELEDPPACKVCNHHTDVRLLVEIPTATGRFYLCHEHFEDISKAKTLVMEA